MNLLEIRNNARVMLREQEADTLDADRFYKNADLNQWINNALNIISVFLEFSEQELTDTLVAGTQAYTFTTALGVSKCYYKYTADVDYIELPIKSRIQLDELFGPSWQTLTNQGPIYALVENRLGSAQVSLINSPSDAGTLKIITTATLATLSADEDIPGINPVYHQFIVDYVVAQGYNADLQFEIATQFMNTWNSNLSFMKQSLTRQGNNTATSMFDTEQFPSDDNIIIVRTT